MTYIAISCYTDYLGMGDFERTDFEIHIASIASVSLPKKAPEQAEISLSHYRTDTIYHPASGNDMQRDNPCAGPLRSRETLQNQRISKILR